ncbi:hypothetical protein Bpfe_003198 [Biomphalaria pfeifferi]|uniref:Uncharacterized protein n=1 Tax=Biomphalaria pfeifferi TaxID=112525 RepID=A0AAD8FJY0_BIOPF|nr:hypothetical protein Bpfe_003198 [Biomphalaria pfeifferi]
MDSSFPINRNPLNVSVGIYPDMRSNKVALFTGIPWLLPVMVAVAMVIFLVISFALHHKRFLLKKKKCCQYYMVHYHRVAIPSPPTPELVPEEENLPRQSSCDKIEETKSPIPERDKRADSPRTISDRLRRCYSLSPRHLKAKASGSPSKTRKGTFPVGIVSDSDNVRLSEERLGTACDKGNRCLHPDHVSCLRVTTGQNLSRHKKRAVVVTTVNGVLARAKLIVPELDPEHAHTVEAAAAGSNKRSYNQDMSDLPFSEDCDLHFIDDFDFDSFTS